MVKQYKITIKVEEVPKTNELKEIVLKMLDKTAVTAELVDLVCCWENDWELIGNYWFNDQFDEFKAELTLNDICKMVQGKGGKFFSRDGGYVGDENIIIRDIGNFYDVQTFDEYITEIKDFINKDLYTNEALQNLMNELELF